MKLTRATTLVPLLAGAALALGLHPLACARSASPPVPSASESDAPVLLERLGSLHHPISTRDPLAQRYFDQGLSLTFGFNHEAAVRAFEYAEHLDPRCAMCAWGSALALGPNINAPMGPDAAARAFEAIARARALAAAGHASPRERAYIAALATRYAADAPSERAHLDRAFAEAMRELHRADPDDLDAAVLLAEALMDLSPWSYWTPDAQPREHTEEVLALLEGVLERDPAHVGANHYLIHALEEHFPERAVPAAERLGQLAPDAGHLVHMPAHIFWRVGRYDDALEINRRAIAADESYFAWCRPGAFYRAAYYPHNIHFLWAAATAQGRSDIALSSASKLAAATRDRLAEFEFLEEFIAIPSFTLARFGRWDAILGLPLPDPAHVYLTGVWHYTRGLARLRLGEPARAREQLGELVRTAADPRAESLRLAGGTASAAQLLAIAAAHLEGEIAAVDGRAALALGSLEAAVDLQDQLSYMEPPPFYFPVRQALAAVLLDLGRAQDAETVYRRDLEQYPANGWSLFGLAQSLEAQGRSEEAGWAREGFRNAFARADVELERSRF